MVAAPTDDPLAVRVILIQKSITLPFLIYIPVWLLYVIPTALPPNFNTGVNAIAAENGGVCNTHPSIVKLYVTVIGH